MSEPPSPRDLRLLVMTEPSSRLTAARKGRR
jgi:hypothetical protein